MAGTNGDEKQVAINGDTSGWNPTVQDQVTLALAANGGLKRIQATLKQRLDEKGWSEDLRNYCTRLFRSGAAVTYDDALTIVMRRIQAGAADPEGADDGVPAPNLSIPKDVQQAGADAVKKELAPIVKQKK